MTDSPYDGLVPEKSEPTKPDTNTGDNDMGKGILRSKTFWFNLLTGTVSIGTYLLNSELVAQYPQVVAIGGTVIGGLNILLRLITKEPINGVK